MYGINRTFYKIGQRQQQSFTVDQGKQRLGVGEWEEGGIRGKKKLMLVGYQHSSSCFSCHLLANLC